MKAAQTQTQQPRQSGSSKTPLYEQIAERIAASIRRGNLKVGEKLPSLRHASREFGVSVATAREAYDVLVSRGFASSSARSGFFARDPQAVSLPAPRLLTRTRLTRRVSVDDLAAWAAGRCAICGKPGAWGPGPDWICLGSCLRHPEVAEHIHPSALAAARRALKDRTEIKRISRAGARIKPRVLPGRWRKGRFIYLTRPIVLLI